MFSQTYLGRAAVETREVPAFCIAIDCRSNRETDGRRYDSAQQDDCLSLDVLLRVTFKFNCPWSLSGSAATVAYFILRQSVSLLQGAFCRTVLARFVSTIAAKAGIYSAAALCSNRCLSTIC